MVERIQSKLEGWKSKLLSLVGSLVLIKSTVKDRSTSLQPELIARKFTDLALGFGQLVKRGENLQ